MAPSFKQQCARVLLEATEPFLHAMQTNERFHRKLLTTEERETFKGLTENTKQLAALLSASMSIPDWQTFMERLMQLGLLERSTDLGDIGDQQPYVDTAPSTEFGKVFIDLCFEEVSAPQFGKFAVSPPSAATSTT